MFIHLNYLVNTIILEQKKNMKLSWTIGKINLYRAINHFKTDRSNKIITV